MPAMAPDVESRVREMSGAKALALASYGESVAAYRYRTLVEKTSSPQTRAVFLEMAEEEKGHHGRVEELIRKHYPGADFVLTPEDKELVIVGPRMLDASDPESYARALDMICETERLTGRLYNTLHAITTEPSLRPFLKEMADECIEHAERLEAL